MANLVIITDLNFVDQLEAQVQIRGGLFAQRFVEGLRQAFIRDEGGSPLREMTRVNFSSLSTASGLGGANVAGTEDVSVQVGAMLFNSTTSATAITQEP